MAKADAKDSITRGFSLAWHFHQSRINGATRREALAHLTALLRSPDHVVDPPLPSMWHLEMGPRDEVLVVTPDGDRRDGRQVFVGYRNLLSPVPLSPKVQAALDGPPNASEPPPPLPPAAGSPPAALVNTQIWLNQALKEHPRMQGELKAAYARRLTKLMREAAVATQWSWKTTLRHLFK